MSERSEPFARRVKTGLAISALAGIGLCVWLVAYYGATQVGQALLAIGWLGLAAMCAVHLVSLILCALAWRVVIIEAPQTVFQSCLWARWLRDGIGNVLPIFPAAGEVVAARELSLAGVPAGVAGASTIVDMTAEMVSQLLFTLLGLGLLIWQRPETDYIWRLSGGLALATALVAGFIIAQRKGLMRFLEALPQKLGLHQPWAALPEANSIDSAMQKIYDDPARVAGSVAVHVAAWIAGAAEAWTALWFMGHPLGFGSILIIESLVFALRTMAFAVPWAAGVQEGGYVMLGALFGLSPNVALALSLLKRVRELLTSVPALVIWQAAQLRKIAGVILRTK